MSTTKHNRRIFEVLSPLFYKLRNNTYATVNTMKNETWDIYLLLVELFSWVALVSSVCINPHLDPSNVNKTLHSMITWRRLTGRNRKEGWGGGGVVVGGGEGSGG